jgi:hypothetical protein
MLRLEVSCAVRRTYTSLGAKGLICIHPSPPISALFFIFSPFKTLFLCRKHIWGVPAPQVMRMIVTWVRNRYCCVSCLSHRTHHNAQTAHRHHWPIILVFSVGPYRSDPESGMPGSVPDYSDWSGRVGFVVWRWNLTTFSSNDLMINFNNCDK